MNTRILAHYYIETPFDACKIAALIAKMQSTGTWKEVTGETKKIINRHGAQVIRVKKIGTKKGYSLPTREPSGKRVTCAIVDISYPIINFGHNIAMLLSTTAGEIFDMAELTAVKLLDLDLPTSFLAGFQGPKFGLEGSKKITGAVNRPMFGAITKPCVGLTSKQIAQLAYEVSRAGADFIKDDELLADAPYNRLKDRVKAVVSGMKKAYEETGKVTMYAFNVTDDPDRALALHDIVKKHGGKAIMFNVLAGGLPLLKRLSEHSELPIHCHRDFSVASIRSNAIGITGPLFTKLTRLCGGDQIQCGGVGGYIFETDDEVLENIHACTAKFGKIKKSLPVSSGGEWAGKLPLNLRKIGNKDFMLLAGGGVFGHPDGGYAGMRSIIDAYKAVKAGVKLEKYDSVYLKRAIEEFGNVIY